MNAENAMRPYGGNPIRPVGGGRRVWASPRSNAHTNVNADLGNKLDRNRPANVYADGHAYQHVYGDGHSHVTLRSGAPRCPQARAKLIAGMWGRPLNGPAPRSCPPGAIRYP